MRNFIGAAALSLSVASGCATTNDVAKVETAPVSASAPKPSKIGPEAPIYLTRADLEECLGILQEDPLPGQDLGKCQGLSAPRIAATLYADPLFQAVEFLEQAKDAENRKK